MHVDAVDLVVLIPAAAEPWKRGAERVAGNTGHDVDFVAGRHPLTAVLVRPVCRRVDFGWEVVGEEEDPQD